MPYIYKITNQLNGKVYIGKTLQSIEQRWKEHCSDYNRPRNEKRPLYDAMKKYGLENFKVEEVEECSEEELNDKETYWIEAYRSFKEGYNATYGGDGKRYADYDLILATFDLTGDITKTTELTGYSADTVSKVVHMNHRHVHNGGEVCRKPIAMIDKNTGEILRTFSHTKEAENFLNIKYTSHISDVCLGKRKTSNGYKWKYI